eukprot:TRINITY_DN16253_c1_g1_i1.p1 TRINITY_DN16253_c1_g1~~TRINITY_DN16253_c1_g1_i1.p1  ORF type:complete len:691 (+),score=210.16 TRINITY_DN16253_c1_g1_i1:96-2168(+)
MDSRMERLERLRQQGLLTEDEFAAAKQAALGSPPPQPGPAAAASPTRGARPASQLPRHSAGEAGKRRRIAVVTANRADYSKLAPVMRLVRESPVLSLDVIVMGAHHLADFGRTVNIVSDDFRDCVTLVPSMMRGDEEEAMAETVGVGLVKLPDVLARLRPDAVVLHGDRFDVLAPALAAAILNIAVFHVEGGELSGTIDDVIRHAVTKFAHYHFVCTPAARERLLAMGEEPRRVTVTGCPVYDELLSFEPDESVPRQWGLEPGKFLLVVYHPVTTDIPGSVRDYGVLLDYLLAQPSRALIVYPNVDAGSKQLCSLLRTRGIEQSPRFVLLKHVPFQRFLSLLACAECVVGNSSAGIREASVFGTPVVNLGQRQAGRDAGENVRHCPDVTPDAVAAAVDAQRKARYFRASTYGTGSAARTMVEVLETVDMASLLPKTIAVHPRRPIAHRPAAAAPRLVAEVRGLPDGRLELLTATASGAGTAISIGEVARAVLGGGPSELLPALQGALRQEAYRSVDCVCLAADAAALPAELRRQCAPPRALSGLPLLWEPRASCAALHALYGADSSPDGVLAVHAPEGAESCADACAAFVRGGQLHGRGVPLAGVMPPSQGQGFAARVGAAAARAAAVLGAARCALSGHALTGDRAFAAAAAAYAAAAAECGADAAELCLAPPPFGDEAVLAGAGALPFH